MKIIKRFQRIVHKVKVMHLTIGKIQNRLITTRRYQGNNIKEYEQLYRSFKKLKDSNPNEQYSFNYYFKEYEAFC